uniref:Energy transducer TonB n=1 Tax=Caenorhabditis tropicalis TaxID=1561998 RepID=A0A1I7U3D0_9PELO
MFLFQKETGPKSVPSETVKEKPKTPPPRPEDNDPNKASKPNNPKLIGKDTKEVNDNETINDAKSDWGELPK